MLETAINSLAIFGLLWVFFLSYLGFRILVHAFSFAAKIGIASARASIIARAHDDVKADLAAKVAAEDDEKEDGQGDKS